MRQKLDQLYWKWRLRLMENFLQDEDGDSNMVAVIVLIVIILAVAAVFRQSLMDAVTKVFQNLTEFIS